MVENAFAVNKIIVYDAKYGENIGEYRYYYYDAPDEASAVPTTFFMDENKLTIDDCHNNRMIIYKLKSIQHEIIKRKYCTSLSYVDLNKYVIFDRLNLYKINTNDSLILYKKVIEQPGDDFNYLLEHPSGIKIIVSSNHKMYFFDREFNQIEKAEIPDNIQIINGAVYFKDKKVFLTDYLPSLEYHVKNHYYELSGFPKSKPVPPLFQLPDSTEWGNYISEENVGMAFLGYDTAYNTYWSYITDSCIGEKIQHCEKIKAVFSYDRIGNLRFWFPEPPIEKGWRKYAGNFKVSREGRIYDMHFYSRWKPEEKIDKTKGIRIIEYIPEQKDFSHSERVKMYGSKDMIFDKKEKSTKKMK
jgi:hypothetical protein